MNKITYLLLISVGLLLTVQCSQGPVAGGSDNPDFNVFGNIVHHNGTPASNTQVTIIPPKYNPIVDGPLPDSLTDTTDTLGNYRFALSDTGTYNIQAVNMLERTRLLITKISLEYDTVIVPQGTLKNTGYLKALLPDTVDTVSGYLFIEGTLLFKELSEAMQINSSTYSLVIDSVPAVTIPSLSYDVLNDPYEPIVLTDTFTIVSNDTTVIEIVPQTRPRISGVVIDSIGSGVTGATVLCRAVILTANGDSVTYEKQVSTYVKGRYEINSIPNGKYILHFTYGQTAALLSKVTLVQGDTLKDLDVTLKPTVTLKGRVFPTYSYPVQDITLSLPGINKETSPDTDGFYTFSDIPVGQHDIILYYGNSINSLPVSFTSTGNDTVYIKDLHYFPDSNRVATSYSYYPYSANKSFSIVPVEYRTTNEPLWYSGKDFSTTTYYRGINDTLYSYTPQVTQLLFVARADTGLEEPDRRVVTRLRESAYTVFPVDDDSLVIDDTLGMDLIYTSFSILSNTLKGIFTNVPKAVLACEDQYYDDLKIASAWGIDTMVATVLITDPSHPIAAGLQDTVAVCSTPSSQFSWGQPAQGADIIAVNPENPARAYVFVFESGAQMVNMTAPARRIGFLASGNTANRFNANGWRLFDAMIEWGLGRR